MVIELWETKSVEELGPEYFNDLNVSYLLREDCDVLVEGLRGADVASHDRGVSRCASRQFALLED